MALLRDRVYGPFFFDNLVSNCGNWIHNVTAAEAMAAAACAGALLQGREAERPPARRPAELAGTEY